MMASGSAQAQTQITLATGAQYSNGNYGDTTSTNALVVPVSARLSFGAWSVRATIPYVTVRGPANLGELLDDSGGRGSNSGSGSSGSGSSGSGSSGSGSGNSGSDDSPSGGNDDGDPTTPPTVPLAADRSVSGLGDSSLSATWSLDSIGNSPVYLDITGRVRFPTGSEADGLGVGATDYFALTELGYSGDRAGMFVSGGRRFLGDASTTRRVDGWQAGAGAWFALSHRFTIGAIYDRRDPSVAGGTAPQFVESYLAWRVNRAWKVEFNVGAGLSDASADYAAGISISWQSARRR